MLRSEPNKINSDPSVTLVTVTVVPFVPGKVAFGPGIDHPVAVNGEVVVVLLLTLLIRRHPGHRENRTLHHNQKIYAVF